MDDSDHYRVEFYVSRRRESLMDDFLQELPLKHRGKIEQWLSQLEKHGPNLPRPYADFLTDGIRELRVQFGNHKYRVLYFFHHKTIVCTHCFLKKTGAVPIQEIERAKTLRTDWRVRYT